jgi:hypothetical protein
MNWDEIEKRLSEHSRSKENVGFPVSDELKNKVWAKVHFDEKRYKSMKFVWLAAACLALFFLSGMAYYIIQFDKMKARNITLSAKIVKLQESNKVLKSQLERTPTIEVTEKTRLIVKTKIVYKTIEKRTETLAYNLVVQSKEIQSEKKIELPEILGLAKKTNNDSVVAVNNVVNENLAPKSNSSTLSDSMDEATEFKPLLSETTKPKWFRLKIGLGNYLSEPANAAWKVSIYSK